AVEDVAAAPHTPAGAPRGGGAPPGAAPAGEPRHRHTRTRLVSHRPGATPEPSRTPRVPGRRGRSFGGAHPRRGPNGGGVAGAARPGRGRVSRASAATLGPSGNAPGAALAGGRR